MLKRIPLLDYYMNRPYRMEVICGQEGIYTVWFPDLPGCVTVGENREEAIINAVDAKESWFKACLEDGIQIPEPACLN